MWLDWIRNDLRFACHEAIRRPAFSGLVAMTLALGLAVATAVFALVDGTLLRGLPYVDPASLVFVWQTLPQHDILEVEVTPSDYQAWRQAHSFSGIALISAETFTLTGTTDPERVRGARVTASLMPLLGIAPRVGRGFEPEEDDRSAPSVAILSDGLWHRRFGADPGVLGRPVQIDGAPATIVGVMPRGAGLPGPLAGNDEIWLPMRMTSAERADRIGHNYDVVARLGSGASLEQASAEMNALATATSAADPETHKGIGTRLVPVREQTVRAIRPALVVLMGGVALLLVITSANVTTLLLARASSRRHELAIRTALGAGRARLLAATMAESVSLAVVGGLVGVALGGLLLRALLPAFADLLPPTAIVDVDTRVALLMQIAAAGLGIVCAFIVGAHELDARLSETLRDGGRSSPSRETARTRRILVVAQVGLAVLLLAGAGLMVRSLVRLSAVQPGFAVDHLLTFRMALPAEGRSSSSSRTAFVRSSMERLATLPGVRAAAVNTRLPFGGNRGANGIAIEGRPAKPGELLVVDQREVSPNYFKALGVPVLEGRAFTGQDDERSEGVTIVNRSMARRFWPDGDPIDKRIKVTSGEEASGWLRIVGVVADVRHVDLSREPVPEMYRPYAQMPLASFAVALRTSGDPGALVPSVRSAIHALDPNLPLYDIRTMEARIARSASQTRATMMLLLVTALLAVALAVVAIYGSIWYSVTQRIPEIGVRLALGASHMSVIRLVVGRALTMTAAGTGVGLGMSAVLTPLLRDLLFDTRPIDPATYAAAGSLLLLLTLAASVLPVRTALRIDPSAALRRD